MNLFLPAPVFFNHYQHLLVSDVLCAAVIKQLRKIWPVQQSLTFGNLWREWGTGGC
jgi:hypothetical protein